MIKVSDISDIEEEIASNSIKISNSEKKYVTELDNMKFLIPYKNDLKSKIVILIDKIEKETKSSEKSILKKSLRDTNVRLQLARTRIHKIRQANLKITKQKKETNCR